MVNIYVLKLENDKYYIGKTNNPANRIEQHFNNNGAVWTKLNKPISIIEMIPNCDDSDEHKYTLKYMKKYGIDNVRGAAFCQTNFNKKNKDILNKMINNENNNCYKCNSSTHYANECYIKTQYKYNDESENDESENDESENDDSENDESENDESENDESENDENENDDSDDNDNDNDNDNDYD
jgi:predicted GIY-YIG superfamily endonuclease